MHVVQSDFSMITVLGNLTTVRSSANLANRRAVERMLKTAAALASVTRRRGGYFAIPREATKQHSNYGEASAQAEHLRPVSYNR
jgi:hypothetical protein